MQRRRVVAAAAAGLGIALGLAAMWGGFWSPAVAGDVLPSFISQAAEPLVGFDDAPGTQAVQSEWQYRRIAQPSQVQGERDCPNDQAPQESTSDL